MLNRRTFIGFVSALVALPAAAKPKEPRVAPLAARKVAVCEDVCTDKIGDVTLRHDYHDGTTLEFATDQVMKVGQHIRLKLFDNVEAFTGVVLRITTETSHNGWARHHVFAVDTLTWEAMKR